MVWCSRRAHDAYAHMCPEFAPSLAYRNGLSEISFSQVRLRIVDTFRHTRNLYVCSVHSSQHRLLLLSIAEITNPKFTHRKRKEEPAQTYALFQSQQSQFSSLHRADADKDQHGFREDGEAFPPKENFAERRQHGSRVDGRPLPCRESDHYGDRSQHGAREDGRALPLKPVALRTVSVWNERSRHDDTNNNKNPCPMRKESDGRYDAGR